MPDGLPSRVSRTTPRWSSWSAAARMRGSSPSGRTMCLLAARARSISWYSNISGVTTLVGLTSRRSRSADPSTCSSKSRRAVSILRADERVSARCDGVQVRGRAHRSGGRGDDRDVHLETGDEPLDRVRQLQPAVEDDARGGREGLGRIGQEQGEQHVGAVGGRDDDAALEQPVEHVRHGHGGDDQPGRLTVEECVVAVDQGAAGGGHELADGGRVEDGVGGDRVCGCATGHALQGRRGRRNMLSRNAVRDDGQHRRVAVTRVVRRRCRRRPEPAPATCPGRTPRGPSGC